MSTQDSRLKRAQQADTDDSEVFASRNEGRTLPDEIVREILIQSPGLIIPYDLFIKNRGVSPFADASHISSSLISVVCKQWLRVATPLLYHTVIVRSKAQGEALERAIRANKEFAKFIRRIRIEVAYGPPMRTILPLATNITDIFLTLNVFSGDNPEGLIKTLPLLRPTTLILHDSGRSSVSKSATAFQDMIEECMTRHWATLLHVYLPSINNSYESAVRFDRLAIPLSRASCLRTIHIFSLYSLKVSFWDPVSTNKPLIQINVQHDENLDDYFVERFSTSNALRLIRIKGRRLNKSEDLSPAPCADSVCSQFDDNIWSRILRFSTMDFDIPFFEKTISSDSNYMLTERLRWYSGVVRLCKIFHRLGIQYLFGFLHLHGYRLCSFVEHVSKNLALASHIKFLMFNDSYDPICIAEKEQQYNENIQEVMKNVRVSALGTFFSTRQIGKSIIISWAAFETLCQSSSETLTHLYPVQASPPSLRSLLTVFASLHNIRYLHWRSEVVSGSKLNGLNVPSTCFPLLEHLEYEENSKSQSKQTLLKAMSHMSLPCLRSFRLIMRRRGQGPDTTSFFVAHGRKLTSLAIPFIGPTSPLKSCPNLTTLTDTSSGLKWMGLDKSFFPAHTSLKTIIYELNLDYLKASTADILLSKHLYSKLTSLEEIQIQDREQGSFWPTTDRELETGKNLWPGRAVELATAGIKLIDCHGKHWTPRLERKGKGRG